MSDTVIINDQAERKIFEATCDDCGMRLLWQEPETREQRFTYHRRITHKEADPAPVESSGINRYLKSELAHGLKANRQLVDLLRYLKETAFAFHLNERHKPEAFSGCGHVICQRACQTWNEAMEIVKS